MQNWLDNRFLYYFSTWFDSTPCWYDIKCHENARYKQDSLFSLLPGQLSNAFHQPHWCTDVPSYSGFRVHLRREHWRQTAVTLLTQDMLLLWIMDTYHLSNIVTFLFPLDKNLFTICFMFPSFYLSSFLLYHFFWSLTDRSNKLCFMGRWVFYFIFSKSSFPFCGKSITKVGRFNQYLLIYLLIHLLF